MRAPASKFSLFLFWLGLFPGQFFLLEVGVWNLVAATPFGFGLLAGLRGMRYAAGGRETMGAIGFVLNLALLVFIARGLVSTLFHYGEGWDFVWNYWRNRLR